MSTSWEERERQHKEWLVGLKAGDEVAVSYDRREQLATVERLTDTQIVTTLGRFRRDDGWLFGKHYHLGRPKLKEATDEIRERIEHKALSESLPCAKFHIRSLDQLRRIAAIISEPTPDKQEK